MCKSLKTVGRDMSKLHNKRIVAKNTILAW